MDRKDSVEDVLGGFKKRRRMILRPDKGGTSDLLRLLVTGDVCNNNLLECDEQEVVGLRHRLLISLSIVIQIMFLYMNRPVARMGRAIENWLNRRGKNQGFLRLLIGLVFHGENNLLTSEDVNSKSYVSILGHADGRVDLDEKIRPGDGRYLPHLTMMAAKVAYENPAVIKDVVQNHWNMDLIDVLNCSNDYYGHMLFTQAMLVKVNPDLVVVSFRGTQPFDMIQWCADVDFSWYEDDEAGRIHEGFMRALGMQSGGEWPKEIAPKDVNRFAYYAVRAKLRRIQLDNPDARFIVTGHSLGGAMAALFPVVLMLHGEDRLLESLDGVYTYGQPRVGDEKLAGFVAGKVRQGVYRNYVRVVYGSDIVPRLPFDDPSFNYKHFGRCVYYDSSYHGYVLLEEPNKNYFSLVYLVPKYLNAWYELFRSFIIGTRRGPDFAEGPIMTFLRSVGLLFPGLPAHVPQDYVNSTRLRLPEY